MKFKHGQEVWWASLDNTRVYKGIFVGDHPTKSGTAVVVQKNSSDGCLSLLDAHRLYLAPKKIKKWAVLFSDGQILTYSSNPKRDFLGEIEDGKVLGIKEFEVTINMGDGLDG